MSPLAHGRSPGWEIRGRLGSTSRRFPITLLLLKHDQSNLFKFLAAGVDAVGIEFHVVLCVVCTIPDRPSLVGKHCEMCINHEVDHLVSRRHVETLAEPVHCQVSGHHGIEEEILQVLLGLWIGEKCFCHVYTIHDLGCCAYFV